MITFTKQATNMKKILHPIAFVMLFAMTSFAHAYNSHYSQQRTEQNDPVKYIKTALDKLEKFNSNTSTASPVLLRTFIENEIIPHFSFDEMSRWITGPYAQRMTQEEKVDFQDRLKEAFLGSLSKHIGSFDAIKNRVRFYPTKYRGREEATVSTQVYRGNDYPVRLDFRMRMIDKDWKIIDVRANGTSAVLYYRKMFRTDLRQYNRRR
jgi:phospholipid transport system substrate-binding protein